MSTEDSSQRAAPQSTPSPGVPRKVLGATLIGTIVEWYDFSIYGFLAVVLAHNFFPQEDQFVGLLVTYSGFAVAYAVRPIAGLIIGQFADRLGRRGVLSMTILSMGLATFLIGLVPGYATIGVAAPVLVIILRLVQGIGASGEWTVGAAFLLEHSPRSRWGRLGAYINMAYYLSLFLGTGAASLLSAVMPGDTFQEWGWRILFLLAAPMALVGRYIRARLSESPEFQAVVRAQRQGAVQQLSMADALRTHWIGMLAFALAGAQQRVAQFAFATFVTTSLIGAGLGETAAFSVVFLGYVISIPIAWAGGPLSDRFGSGLVMKAAIIALTLVAVPSFMLIDTGRFWPALLASALFIITTVIMSAPKIVIMVGMFPPAVRGAASGLSYNLTTLAFGASSPLVATWLRDATDGSNTTFSWYIVALGAISYMALHISLKYFEHEMSKPAPAADPSDR